MKLYTEEQVIEMINKCQATGLDADYLLDLHKHIELPSDEEIKEASLVENNDLSFAEEFVLGAKFVINKIQGGNDE